MSTKLYLVYESRGFNYVCKTTPVKTKVTSRSFPESMHAHARWHFAQLTFCKNIFSLLFFNLKYCTLGHILLNIWCNTWKSLVSGLLKPSDLPVSDLVICETTLGSCACTVTGWGGWVGGNQPRIFAGVIDSLVLSAAPGDCTGM